MFKFLFRSNICTAGFGIYLIKSAELFDADYNDNLKNICFDQQSKLKKIKMVSFGQREVILIKIQIEFYIR